MVLDFNKLLGQTNTSENVADPREIFNLLTNKDKKYSYLWDVQSEVLKRWFNKDKDVQDTVLKMNTGSGKTIVGLLILKSCLNENISPAVYITPDPYLTKQVIKEANSIGISVTENTDDFSFRKGKSIFVGNIYKLINGKSVFGTRDTGCKISIGSIIIDDVHACLSKTDEQFTISLSNSNEVYQALLQIFQDTMKQQSNIKLSDIKAGDPQAIMTVPFWAWQENIDKVETILHSKKESNEELIFKWPLLKEHLKLCTCIFSGDSVEISPRIIPIDVISSFTEAKRRIFMSATLADNSVLVSHFNADIKAIKETLTPETANDVGDRMILMPEALNPNISDDDLKLYFKQLSIEYNVVVLVPSEYRLSFWDGAKILRSNNLEDEIQKLKEGHVGLSVILNKYDGIDLGGNACRILVIDGIPDVRKKLDKIDEMCLSDTDEGTLNTIQKIEQGMGRGIRSNDDQCIVFFMGKSLINKLCVAKASDYFTPATKAQMRLSEQVTQQIKDEGGSLENINEAIKISLDRNEQWIQASKGALANLRYDNTGVISSRVLAQKKSFDKACINDHINSVAILNEYISKVSNTKVKGWLKQQCAEYINFYDKSEAQEMLKSALEDNRYIIIRPIRGITYRKLNKANKQQAQICYDFLSRYSNNTIDFLMKINSISENLMFQKNTYNDFEEAMKELGEFLGFNSERTEQIYGKGPDVLWDVGDSTYFVIECKNGATSEKVSKRYCDQLSGSINWFKKEYSYDCKPIPIMIHPSNVLDFSATPDKDTRIITKEKLLDLKQNIQSLSQSIISGNSFHGVDKIQDQLQYYYLNHKQFIQKYTCKPKGNEGKR